MQDVFFVAVAIFVAIAIVSPLVFAVEQPTADDSVDGTAEIQKLCNRFDAWEDYLLYRDANFKPNKTTISASRFDV